ncbi:response regulator [Vagococcus elongatus]|uniref:response regulator n=1 Tax=Vagococcus elongatus TaxID=180344 RepID=UPI000F877B0B|nr:response regulator [Vagococcus elongatus]
MGQAKIFLLEDDETLGFGIKTFLENEGYSVTLARNLAEAKHFFDFKTDVTLPFIIYF